MRIAVVGGGPGGLLFATVLAQLAPGFEIHLYERNRAEDAFGFGVVFSDATQRGIDEADSVLRETLDADGSRWDRIEVRLRGETFRFAGNGMGAILRTTLLTRLQDRARESGVQLHFSTTPSPAELDDADLVVAADGANSTLRDQHAEHLGISVTQAEAKFIWFATPQHFEGLTFLHAEAPGIAGAPGVFAAHAYPIGGGLSTFIVETDPATWRAAGLDAFDPATPPGVSDATSQGYLERLFADHLEGHGLVSNNSRWASFRTIRAASWHHGKTVFLGDAVHTAHFSVGSGTKMAMEDAIALARAVASEPARLDLALQRYEQQRQPAVARIQDAAGPSLAWWERFGEYYHALEPWQFAFHFFSRAIPLSKIRRRDPLAASAALEAWQERVGATPLDAPLTIDSAAGPRTLPRLASPPDLLSLGDDLVRIPAGEEGPGVTLAVDAALAGRAPSAVLVHGGTALGRALTAETVRMALGFPAFIEEPGCDEDRAETLILSGRADGVLR